MGYSYAYMLITFDGLLTDFTYLPDSREVLKWKEFLKLKLKLLVIIRVFTVSCAI